MQQYVFLGSLDDELQRWPPAYAINRAYLNALVTKCLLIGDTMIVSDGHVFQNPYAQDEFFQRPDSPIAHLVRHGEIRIAQRTASLSELPQRLQNKGPDSFKRSFDEFDAGIRRLDDYIGRNGLRLIGPEPEAFWNGYASISKDVLKHSAAALGLGAGQLSDDVWQAFVDAYGGYFQSKDRAPSRQQWMYAIDHVLGPEWVRSSASKQTGRILMNLANEISHINSAACLSRHCSLQIGVETASGAWSRQALLSSNVLHDQPGRFETLLSVPWPNNILSNNSIDVLLSSASEVSGARREFIEALRKLRAGHGSVEELQRAGEPYSRLLREHFSKPVIQAYLVPALSFALMSIGFSLQAFGSAAIVGLASGGFGLSCLAWIADQYLPWQLSQLIEFPHHRDRRVERAASGETGIPTLASPLKHEFVDAHTVKPAA